VNKTFVVRCFKTLKRSRNHPSLFKRLYEFVDTNKLAATPAAMVDPTTPAWQRRAKANG
jgi:hypothetical protein